MSEREPITAELRELMGGVEPRVDEDGVVTAKYVTPEAWAEFVRRCDAIDAVHAGLERENAELRQRVSELDKRGESMHDGGRITDELRAWWVRKFPVMDKELHKDFTAIADRIDAEHEEAIQQVLMNEGGVPATDENMAEHGWVRLPLDADGVPIRVGDVMEGTCPSGKHVNGAVNAIGDGVFWLSNVQFSLKPEYMHHHHAPTVEDVLREFGIEWEYEQHSEDRAAILAEYVAKLRLAEGEDA